MGLFNSVKTPDNTTHTVSLPYGYCETAAGTAAKTVTVPNVTELTTGLAIIVRFKNSNSASSPTLNVNGLGAKIFIDMEQLKQVLVQLFQVELLEQFNYLYIMALAGLEIIGVILLILMQL